MNAIWPSGPVSQAWVHDGFTRNRQNRFHVRQNSLGINASESFEVLALAKLRPNTFSLRCRYITLERFQHGFGRMKRRVCNDEIIHGIDRLIHRIVSRSSRQRTSRSLCLNGQIDRPETKNRSRAACILLKLARSQHHSILAGRRHDRCRREGDDKTQAKALAGSSITGIAHGMPIRSEDIEPLHFMKSPSSLGGENQWSRAACGEDREAVTAPPSLRGAKRRSNPVLLRSDGLLRGACHRARVRATRWLAMTAAYSPLIIPASIRRRLKRRASAPFLQA
jgi:hypothetical protein